MAEAIETIVRQGIQFVIERDDDPMAHYAHTLVCLGQTGLDYEPVKGFGSEPTQEMLDHWIAAHFKQFLPWPGEQPDITDHPEEESNLYRLTDKGTQPSGEWKNWQEVADWIAEGHVGTYTLEIAGR
jgi:hypothetical protein